MEIKVKYALYKGFRHFLQVETDVETTETFNMVILTNVDNVKNCMWNVK
ncbi:MAG: hypothetical protein NC122_09355 [Faecalibacterium sp.]|nr:hypothetical protein [Ruminococcus sp.]MCM1392409.1 hypothetical protein [Ruminococcus sp.]MCM1486397.1 hypothetical protein [Faecalibacterium sp.]